MSRGMLEKACSSCDQGVEGFPCHFFRVDKFEIVDSVENTAENQLGEAAV